jgi:hypothetical protein
MIKLGDILNELLCEKEDRCKRIADKRYDKPSAYKSGAIVRCRQGKIWKDLKEEIKAKEAYRDEDAIQTVIDGKRELGYITLKLSTIPEETFWNIIENNKLKTLKVPSNPHGAYIYYIEGAESKASRLKDIAEKYDGFLAYYATEEDSIQIGRLLSYREEDIEAYIEHNRKLRGKNIKEGLEDTSWTGSGGKKITLQQLLDTIKEYPVIQAPIEKVEKVIIKKDTIGIESDRLSAADVKFPIIIIIDNNGNYKYILDGNHRANKAIDAGLKYIPAKLVNIKKLPQEFQDVLSESESLHKWFSRQGGEGRSRGWVDCNTCEKNPKTDRKKCKPCGRQKGEDRAKYPSCRPTPTQCTREGKGKTWGKTK